MLRKQNDLTLTKISTTDCQLWSAYQLEVKSDMCYFCEDKIYFRFRIIIY